MSFRNLGVNYCKTQNYSHIIYKIRVKIKNKFELDSYLFVDYSNDIVP